jgi:hypothetical protein
LVGHKNLYSWDNTAGSYVNTVVAPVGKCYTVNPAFGMVDGFWICPRSHA